MPLLSVTRHFYPTSRCQVKIPRLDKSVFDYQCLFELIRSGTGGTPAIYSLQASMNSETVFYETDTYFGKPIKIIGLLKCV